MAEEDQGDVYWVNKLIEIEHLDWSRQLEKAVCGLHPIFDFLMFSLMSQKVSIVTNDCLFPQGFKDSSLSVWEASCVIRNFETRTGRTVS